MSSIYHRTSVSDSMPPQSKLPIEPIPGDWGIPFFSPIKDRLDFFYFQGPQQFFQSRIDKYGSTVFRTNMPPGPFIASDPRVICVLDAKSFPVLFDNSKVEKRNVFTGTYMPSTSLTGGYRVCSYLDPAEPDHSKCKQLLFNLLASRKHSLVPAFESTYSALFDAMEAELRSSSSSSSSSSSNFNKLNDKFGLDFVCDAYFGVAPPASLYTKAAKWLLFQLHPLTSLGLRPFFLEDLLLHTISLPPFLIKSDYKALYSYFDSAADAIFSNPDKLFGLSREEACHNLLFATLFNTYGGVKVLFPGILKFLAQAGQAVHARLAGEIRSAVKSENGKVTFAALEKMELTKSFVYEALRMDPPVRFQYGKAKKDLLIESHAAAYKVKKGEMIFGYQPFATRDGMVFENGGEFVADRFVGEKGKGLLKYVVWSNGPETESPTLGNKQCAGKEMVVVMARLLVVEFFMRYDTFTAEVGTEALGDKVTITSVTKVINASG